MLVHWRVHVALTDDVAELSEESLASPPTYETHLGEVCHDVLRRKRGHHPADGDVRTTAALPQSANELLNALEVALQQGNADQGEGALCEGIIETS